MRTLEEIANEYVTQDNLGTRHPIIWILRNTEFKPNIHDEGNYVVVYEDGETRRYEDNDLGFLKSIEDYCNVEGKNFDELKDEYSPDYIDLIDMLKEFYPFAVVHTEDKVKVEKPKFFFTKTGFQDHLKLNGHNLNDPDIYLHYIGDRNPEL
ncbi:MAG: hypothetical protein AB7E61_06295 [Acholeplasmataceae bacterium]